MKKLIYNLAFIIILSVSMKSNYSIAQWVISLNNIGGGPTMIKSYEQYAFLSTNGHGVFRSTSSGIGWTGVGGGLSNGNVWCLEFMGSILFAGTTSGIYKSNNLGNNWVSSTNNLPSTNVTALVAKNNKLFAGTQADSAGVFVSTNYGSSWTRAGINDIYVYSLKYINNNLFAGTHSNGVLVTTNDGINWSEAGLTNRYINLLETDGVNLFAGTDAYGLYMSSDLGHSWNNIGFTGKNIYGISIIKNNIFVSGTEIGVQKSTNFGNNWIPLNDGFNSPYLVYILQIVNNNILAGVYYESLWRRTMANLIIPVKVILSSPKNDTTNVSIYPALIWNEATGSAGYRIKIATDSIFQNIVDSTSILTNQYIVPNGRLTNLTKYYWKVKGFCSLGEGEESDIWNFKTIGLPIAPVLIKPQDGSNQTPTPTFKWGITQYASRYRLQIADSTQIFNGNNLKFDTTLAIDSLKITNLDLLTPQRKYYWRVAGINISGQQGLYSSAWNFRITLTGITRTYDEIPKEYKMYVNYPNPFNPVTKIKFDLPKSSGVKITVFDVTGKEVAVLVNEKLQAGTYQTDWDASAYPSGVYFYRMETDGFSETRKMMLIK